MNDIDAQAEHEAQFRRLADNIWRVLQNLMKTAPPDFTALDVVAAHQSASTKGLIATLDGLEEAADFLDGVCDGLRAGQEPTN